MRTITQQQGRIPSILAYMLIPISGFSLDVYIPSFPQMVTDFGVNEAAIRMTMTVFVFSYGLSQLFVGSLIDHFGRYRFNLAALLLFMLTNVVIIYAPKIELVLAMRVLQGILISIIMMAKRSLFVDLYEGEQRRRYTSLLSIVWATAPIVAPFLGGYLGLNFGWRANFWFLTAYAGIMLVLELMFSGETLKTPGPIQLKPILKAYTNMLRNTDFSLGIIILGLSYAMMIVFNMTIPFIVENNFHLSAVETGYTALGSGVAMLLGGLLSRALIQKDFHKKLRYALLLQVGVAILFFATRGALHHILAVMSFVFLLHLLVGFVYNVYFTYCLTRFPQFAGISGGITSGGAYFVTALASNSIAAMLAENTLSTLSISYVTLSMLAGAVLIWIKLSNNTAKTGIQVGTAQ
ncbi:MFS transporter [Chitinophaga sp. Hz27]|uniref:MFS transporter n=1 Tax=Chitinophaga sp. Hz27 TaxID=3347169 RepID=UPI0035DBD85A